jgi:hypothetical protein
MMLNNLETESPWVYRGTLLRATIAPMAVMYIRVSVFLKMIVCENVGV